MAVVEIGTYLALAKATQQSGGKVLCTLTDHLMEPVDVNLKYKAEVRV
jgi:hypothetical protein